MSRSQRITWRDIRDVYETVHECRELWADPHAWQTHAARRATRLANCRMGLIYEIEDADGYSANRILSVEDVGWESPGERQQLVVGVAQRPLRASPLWTSFADSLPKRGGDGRSPGSVTLVQDRFIEWSEWEANDWYDSYVRPTRLGLAIMSGVWMPQTGTWSCWCLANDRSDGQLTPRQQRLTALLHGALAPMIGASLCTWRNRSTNGLSPLRRQVLAALLDGHGEPAIAAAMHRTHAAIHQHVKAIYLHFGVNSRAELAGYFVRRQPGPAGANPESLDDWLRKRWTASRQ